jgi:hypothetical protein
MKGVLRDFFCQVEGTGHGVEGMGLVRRNGKERMGKG